MSTYSPIASQTLGSAAASVTFSSIPQGYTDLVLVANFATSTSDYVQIILNSDTTVSNYSGTYILGNGTSAASGRYTGANGAYWLGGSTQTATTVGNGMARYMFQNYSNSTTYKTVLQRADSAGSAAGSMVGLWRNTAPITSITFQIVNGQTINSGSTFSLYGIQVGDKAQKAQGGNIVTSDGTYVYHTFTSSGSFTTNQALTVDYLVVAGGGGGGRSDGAGAGGGGAGGLRSTVTATGGGGSLESALSLTASTNYTVTVGAGGTGGTSSASPTQGSNSIFSTITSTGGGKGGHRTLAGTFQAAGTGGSGGGGSGEVSTSGAAGTANQGYAGGNGGNSGANYGGGGGGGAGAVGANGTGSTGGNGGAGVAVAISGSSVTYAGGGGAGGYINGFTAGTGGSGGGGNGGSAPSTTGGTPGDAGNGTVSLGGGGGGGSSSTTVFKGGGAGGSGVVIIRYAL